jgi:hypothetical protein
MTYQAHHGVTAESPVPDPGLTPLLESGMDASSLRQRLQPIVASGTGVVLLIALLKLVLHLWVNAFAGYGFFRDELYYIVCSDHLDAGYVDQPPLSLYLLALSRFLFGDSLFAVRLIPAVAGSLTVFTVGLITRELGGGRFAQGLSALAALTSLIFLAMSSYYSMNALDILAWTILAYSAVRLLTTENPRCWVAIGLVLGLGALNKVSILWLGAGLYAGLLATPHRRWFRTPWPYAAAGLAFVLFLPYIVWNIRNDFATLEFIRNATSMKYGGLGAGTFLVGQILVNNPVTFPLWLTGLGAVLFGKKLAHFRLIGWMYLVPLAILLVNGHSKPEYLSPVYGVLFAAGAVVWESVFSKRPWTLLRPLSLTALAASFVILVPITVPLLPVERYIGYADFLGITQDSPEGKKLDKLPQYYADMFGWPEKAAAVAAVFTGLSPEERAQCAIVAMNYGRAAAVDVFGRYYGLPRAISPHNNYWIWGTQGHTGELVIWLGGDLDFLRERFASVEIAGAIACKFCMPYESNLNIYLCRNPRRPFAELWQELKHYE